MKPWEVGQWEDSCGKMSKPIRVRDLTLWAVPRRVAGIPQSSISQRLSFIHCKCGVGWREWCIVSEMDGSR